MAKPVQFRDVATVDLESASNYYVAEADVSSASVAAVGRFHLTSLMTKIGVRNRVGLAMRAYETRRIPASADEHHHR